MSVSLEKEEDDDPFKLIQKGNAFEAASDHWRSSEFYTRASISLRRRADDISAQIRSSSVDDTKSNEEKKKVISLYRAQSLEYMYKARHCLMQALQFENDQDRSNTLSVAKSGVGSLDPLYSMISNEEGRKRRLIFETLFTGDIDSDDNGDGLVEESAVQMVDNNDEEAAIQEEQSTIDTVESAAINSNTISSAQPAPKSSTSTNQPPISDTNGIDDRQQSIEARLAQLDTSLLPNVPPPFISGSRTSNGDNQNRLNEIQKGLKGLGISLPDNSGKKDLISDNLSSEEQIKLIIQQAKDEARFEKGLHDNNESNDDDIIDENDSMFAGYNIDDEDDEGYDIDILLSKAEKLVSSIDSSAKDGKEGSSSSELVQITKVQALLLEARLCLEMVNNLKFSEQILMENNLQEHVTDEQGKEEVERSPNDDDAKHEDEPPISSSDSETLAAKEKARVLIQSAQDCLNNLLTQWK